MGGDFVVVVGVLLFSQVRPEEGGDCRHVRRGWGF